MSSLIALAVSVGVLAVVATWIFFLDPVAAANLQVWQAFIAWGCHYHCGGKITGTRNTIVCMSFGAVVGMAAMLLAAQLGALGAVRSTRRGRPRRYGHRAVVEAAVPRRDSGQRLRLRQHRRSGLAGYRDDSDDGAGADDSVGRRSAPCSATCRKPSPAR